MPKAQIHELEEIKLGKPLANTPQEYAALIAKQLRSDKEHRKTMKRWNQGAWMEVGTDALNDSNAQQVILDEPIKQDAEYDNEWTAISCGSTGCVAGHIVVASGARLLIPTDEISRMFNNPDRTVDVNMCWTGTKFEGISEVAARLLGLHPDQTGTYTLFSGSNSLAEVLNMLDVMAEGKPLREAPAYQHITEHYGNDEDCRFCFPPEDDTKEAYELSDDDDLDSPIPGV